MVKQNRGFTLVEAIMVIALIAIMVISVPPMVYWMQRQGIGHAVNQLQADLQLARMMAISRQKACTVQFNQPAGNQYQNLLSGNRTDLSVYRGGVRFLLQGPDGMPMADEMTFNRQGMSTSVAPIDIFMSDREKSTVYRLRVLLPGGVARYRWLGDRWQ